MSAQAVTAAPTASGRLLARLDGWANRLYGAQWNPLYHSGALTLALLTVVLVTGIYLLLFYRLGAPYESVARLTAQPWSGRWIRGLHRYASDAAVVTALVHAFRLYAQRRTWGARALAWMSGVMLLGAIFVCGWTGYVMVWDVQAHALAVEGARFLDALPIFSEPIGRAFVGERPLPSAFFFLNLFAHVALPVGLGLLLWVHISRLARPVLFPARKVFWAMTLAFTALALVLPVSMAPAADLLRLPQRVPLDVFYGFWLPVTRVLPAWSVWALGTIMIGAFLGVPWLTRPARAQRPAKSAVNERACTGCEQCVRDCPFDAISLVPSTLGRAHPVAQVNPDLCVSCGICAGSCAPMVIGPPGRSGRDQLANARAFIDRTRPGAGDVVVIGCTRSAARVATPGMVHYPVGCAGSVHSAVIETFVRAGVAGVMVAACPVRDCHGREGGTWLHERLYHGREAELKPRVDRRRLRVVHYSTHEQRELNDAIAAFRAETSLLSVPESDDEIDVLALCEGAG